jgi:hypothetical protein
MHNNFLWTTILIIKNNLIYKNSVIFDICIINFMDNNINNQ